MSKLYGVSPLHVESNMEADNKPIFIVGSGRSGTSVLTWCLGQHPNILPLPETHWIARLSVRMRQFYQFGTVHGRYTHLGALDWTENDFYAEFGRYVDQFIVNTREPRLRFIRKLAAKRRGLSDEQMDELERRLEISPDPVLVSAKNYQVVRSAQDPKRRWVDGGPENTFYMYSLSQLFPEAKFVHLLRDPNDVARSFMKFSQAGSGGADRSEDDAYQQWLRYVEYAVKGEKALGGERVFRMAYDDLVNDSERALRECFGFLGEEYCEDALLPLQEKINSSSVAGHDNAKKIIPTTQKGREANEYYRSILNFRPSSPDGAVLSELAELYRKYADELNN